MSSNNNCRSYDTYFCIKKLFGLDIDLCLCYAILCYY